VRRQVATIAAIVVTALVAAAVATAGTFPGAIAYSGTASRSNPAVRPPYIVFSGDSSHLFAGTHSVRRKIHWTSWTATGAAATGAAMWINDCDPACADGSFYGYPVRLKLSRPGHLGGHLIFHPAEVHLHPSDGARIPTQRDVVGGGVRPHLRLGLIDAFASPADYRKQQPRSRGICVSARAVNSGVRIDDDRRIEGWHRRVQESAFA